MSYYTSNTTKTANKGSYIDYIKPPRKDDEKQTGSLIASLGQRGDPNVGEYSQHDDLEEMVVRSIIQRNSQNQILQESIITGSPIQKGPVM